MERLALFLTVAVLALHGARAVAVDPLCARLLSSDTGLFGGTPILPYFNSGLVLKRQKNTLDGPRYSVEIPDGESPKFSVAHLLEFYFAERIYERELNHAVRSDVVRVGVHSSGLPRMRLRLSVVSKYISEIDAETFLAATIKEIADLPLVTWIWKDNLKSEQAIRFMRSIAPREMTDQELLGAFDRNFSRIYASLPVERRLLLSLQFFDDRVPLAANIRTIEKYLFQDTQATRDRAFAELRRRIEDSIFRTVQGQTPTPTFRRSYTPEVVVSDFIRIGPNRAAVDARDSDFDPHPHLDTLNVSDHIIQLLESRGIVSQDKLLFYSAQKLAEDANLSREEFVELALALFDQGIFLNIRPYWDLRKWRVLQEYPYLRLPTRDSPKDGVDRSPIPRRLYDEFD